MSIPPQKLLSSTCFIDPLLLLALFFYNFVTTGRQPKSHLPKVTFTHQKLYNSTMFKLKSSAWMFLLFPIAFSGYFAVNPVTAQTNSGLTIFSGVKRDNLLNHYLEWGVGPNRTERYKLSIPAKKMMQGASKLFITYPDYYDGKFDEDRIEVRIKGKAIELAEVIWDEESRIIEIVPKEQITESRKLEIVMHNVKNPSSPGTFYFNCQLIAANDLPIRQHVGTWIIGIDP